MRLMEQWRIVSKLRSAPGIFGLAHKFELFEACARLKKLLASNIVRRKQNCVFYSPRQVMSTTLRDRCSV